MDAPGADLPPGLRTPLGRAVGLLLAALAGLFLRLGPRPVLDAADAVFIHDPDACLHLRRTFVLLARGAIPDWDAWSSFPLGHEHYFMPLLDWIAGAVCLLFGIGAGDEPGVARVAAWIPPVLGALTAIPVYAIARRLFGPVAGLAAAFALAVLPGHVSYSAYGRFDHHVLESFLVMSLIAVQTVGGALERRPWLRGALAAALLAALVLAWHGAPTYLAMYAGISLLAVWRERNDRVAQGPRQAAIALLLLLPMLVAIVAQFPAGARGEARFNSPSLFHLALAGAGLVAAAACAWLLPRAGGALDSSPWTPWRRVGLVLGVAAAVGGVWLALPGALGRGLAGAPQAVSYALNDLNVEGRSVLSHWPWSFPQYGSASFLLPALVFAVCLREERRDAPRTELWVWAGWTLASFLLSAHMIRFTYLHAPFLAIAVAGSARAAADWVAERRPALGSPRTRAGVAAACFVFLLAPCLHATMRMQASWSIDAAGLRWLAGLRHATPEPGDWLHPEERPAWGVFCSWNLGNLVQFWARRPTVSDNLGVDLAREFRVRFETDEERAVAALREYGVRYLIAAEDPDTAPHEAALWFGGAERQPFFVPLPDGGWQTTQDYHWRVTVRLFESAGASPGPGHAALASFRLIRDYAPGTPQAMRLFERVPGARVRGSGPAGAEVTLEATVAEPGGVPWLWINRARCDAQGRFEIAVPYATETVPGRAGPVRPIQVRCGDRTREVAVPEAAVLEGRAIELDG